MVKIPKKPAKIKKVVKKASTAKKESAAVSKKMTIGEVIQKHPESIEIMMNHGLHCIGCHVAAWETIEQGCTAHGLDDKEIGKMINEINKAIQKKK